MITAPFSGYSYLAANGTSHLTLTAQQETALEAALTLTPGANTNNGSATWSYDVTDSKFDFLAAGETLTLTVTSDRNPKSRIGARLHRNPLIVHRVPLADAA